MDTGHQDAPVLKPRLALKPTSLLSGRRKSFAESDGKRAKVEPPDNLPEPPSGHSTLFFLTCGELC